MKMTTAELRYFKILKERYFKNGEKTCYFHSGFVEKRFQNMGLMENMIRCLG